MASFVGGALYRRPNFTQEDLRNIRKKYADGVSTRKLAAEYNCSNATIYNIALNKTHATHTTKVSLPALIKEIATKYDVESLPADTLARLYEIPVTVVRAIIESESAKFQEQASKDPRSALPPEFLEEWATINAEALEVAEATRQLRDKQIDFRRRVNRSKLATQVSSHDE